MQDQLIQFRDRLQALVELASNRSGEHEDCIDSHTIANIVEDMNDIIDPQSVPETMVSNFDGIEFRWHHLSIDEARFRQQQSKKNK